MRLLVCGARGSTPAPGAEFVRYGGNTSCVAISADGKSVPSLVLDAGTGLGRLSQALEDRPFRGTILLGHLHWDHTHGLPFFGSGDHPESRVELLLPAQRDGEDAEEVLARAISPPHFPIRPREFRGDWRFRSVEAGEHEVESFAVVALDIPHKGGRTFGYRVSDGRTTVAYLSDHSPLAEGPGPDGLGEYHTSAVALARDVDLLIHDAQHTGEELASKGFLGHSAAEYAIGLAQRAGARRVLLFHHDPPRTDDELDVIVDRLRAGSSIELSAAVEGTTIDLGRSAR